MVGGENSGEILDLLGELTNIRSECSKKNRRREGDEEMELSLGLSMNGKFGVDKKLKRCCCSSSVALPHPHAPLSRTLSLPAEEEEWGRRKELQTMRRMEARKKRMEKLKRVPPREKEEYSGVDGNGGETGLLHHHEAAANGGDSKVPTSENGEVIVESSSQGSMAPLRSASSENQDSVFKLPSPVHHQPRSFSSHYAAGRKQNAEVSPSGGRSPNCTTTTAASGGQQQLQNTMPYVTTKSTGPDGRRVEGFLYGYRKGESVRIMCVCHGEFFTPKEFVEHGGGDVEHPLRHIVVSPFPLL